MYAPQAMPTPRPTGSLPCLFAQSDRVTTCRMHSASPMVPMRIQFAVSVFGLATIFKRSSAGSMLSFAAILSSWISCPKRGCGVPWPRLGPHAGLLVNIRHASNL